MEVPDTGRRPTGQHEGMTRRQASRSLGRRLDESRWFGIAWSVGSEALLMAGAVFGVAATQGAVRIVLLIVAIVLGVLLSYTILVITMGNRWLRGFAARIERDRRTKRR
jgi:hypothetical protein